MHKLDTALLKRAITMDVAGAGGNGSQVIGGLARLHVSLLALGHPHGLKVRLWDDDIVTEANIGRQLFAATDIGQPKAAVLINRINAFYGLDWEAVPKRLNRGILTTQTRYPVDFLIGCVDTKAARREFHEFFKMGLVNYWLDLGNEAHTGQVVLGQSPKCTDDPMRLPAITELFPKLLNPKAREDAAPSCSLAVALERQELFVNQSVTTFALNLLWRLFRFGEIDHHGYFVNVRSGIVTPLPIDPKAWARFGSRRGEASPRVSPECSHVSLPPVGRPY